MIANYGDVIPRRDMEKKIKELEVKKDRNNEYHLLNLKYKILFFNNF